MPDLRPGYNLIRTSFGARARRSSVIASVRASNPMMRGKHELGSSATRCAPRMTAGDRARNQTMFEKGLLNGKAHTGHRRRFRAGCCDGTPLRRARRRTDHLRPPARIAGGDGGADARRVRRQGQRRQMRHPRRRRGRCHDGRGLARGAARRAGQQCRRDLHRADRASVVSRGGRDSRADPARRDVLHARCRQALDRRRRTRAWC